MVSLGLVVASYHGPITEQLGERARTAAPARHAEVVEAESVPGAYDTPLAADRVDKGTEAVESACELVEALP